jgi:ParB-like chromosome segregation protein Spo0J
MASKALSTAGADNGKSGLRIECRPVESLVPHPGKPRTHSPAQIDRIAASIREFGFTNPILLDGDNGVIAGHGRLAAAGAAGLKTVPCIELGHLTPRQKRAYVIADNKLAINAGWDEELLRAEVQFLEAAGIDLALTGFDQVELADVIMGKDFEFKEYDESVEGDVQMTTCPSCGHTFPK